MTSYYHDSKISGSQQQGVFAMTKANSKINVGLDRQNNNFASALCFFVHFLAVVVRLRHEPSLFHAAALWSR